MQFYENFLALCASLGKSQTEVLEGLGMSRSCMTKWKNGALPSSRSLYKLAKYFGISTEDLMHSIDLSQLPFNVTEEEKALLNAWRSCPESTKGYIAGVLAPYGFSINDLVQKRKII